MLDSKQSFRVVYNSLVHGFSLQDQISTSEDALLLLIALLNDLIYAQRSNRMLANDWHCSPELVDNHGPDLRNPYLPLSVTGEHSRLLEAYDAALTRWCTQFGNLVEPSITVLYHFARLALGCPELCSLSRLAGYRTVPISNDTQRAITITDMAVDAAWQILDQGDTCIRSTKDRLAIWLPLSLFMSALVVWKQICSSGSRGGSLKILEPFRTRLASLPWPCCTEMVCTLDRLTSLKRAK